MSTAVEKMIATLRRDPYLIRDERILEAMSCVPREEFLPESWKFAAYDDRALPLGHGQTISQPFIVAAMLEMLDPKPEHRVLEVGSGSGYQAAVLAKLVHRVYTTEIVSDLAGQARKNLARLGIENVSVRHGDGRDAWIEQAPFERIIIACAPRQVPEALRYQLVDQGLMVYPEGDGERQYIYVTRRKGDTWTKDRQFAVRFVPMTQELR